MKVIYWIDDTHDQQKPPEGARKKRLERGLKATIEPKQIARKDEFNEFLSKLDAESTLGIILDYQLTGVEVLPSQKGDAGKARGNFGTTWASEIRSLFPMIPIIGISHEKESQIPRFRLEQYIEFYSRDRLTGLRPPTNEIHSIFHGYKKLAAIKRKSDQVKEIIDLVEPPTQVRELLAMAVPANLRQPWDVESAHVASRWIWHDLQTRPGFLLDRLAASTVLGLNEHGFSKVESQFQDARYKGIFSSEERPRWWAASIADTFKAITRDSCAGPMSQSRSELLTALRIPKRSQKRYFSIPYPDSSSKLIPECVAYRDDTREREDRVQTLVQRTKIDPQDENPPFGFQSRRIYIGSDIN